MKYFVTIASLIAIITIVITLIISTAPQNCNFESATVQHAASGGVKSCMDERELSSVDI